MSGFLLDSNVLFDIATADPTWLAWSEAQFRIAAAQGPIPINPIIYAELAPAFATQASPRSLGRSDGLFGNLLCLMPLDGWP